MLTAHRKSIRDRARVGIVLGALLVAGAASASPHLLQPPLGEPFLQYQSITYCWNRVPGAQYYLLSFASSVNGQFENCQWDTPRVIQDTCATYDHQDVHDPLVWRVQAVCDGFAGNASIGYHFVGTASPVVEAPTIIGPWGENFLRNASILHSWQAVPNAAFYEIQFANALPHLLHRFDECAWDQIRTVYGTSVYYDHQSVHCPIYWRIRAVDAGGHRSNWVGSYYFVEHENCPWCNLVGVQPSTWSLVKHLFK